MSSEAAQKAGGRAMSTRDELAKMVRQLRNLDSRGLADALIAEGWRKKPDRGDLSNFLFTIYDHGTNPNALAEADAILAFLDRGQ